MKTQALALLDAMGISDWAEAWPRQLSGGMQQRVAVARALMNDPPLVLADEPTGNLDTETSDQVMELLLKRNSESSTAFLIVTHDSNLARAVRACDRAGGWCGRSRGAAGLTKHLAICGSPHHMGASSSLRAVGFFRTS